MLLLSIIRRYSIKDKAIDNLNDIFILFTDINR